HFESAVESFASYVHPDVLLKSTWSLAKTLKVDEETLAHWGVLNQGNGRVFQYSQFLVPGTPDLAVSSREIGQPFTRRRSHGAVADQWRAAKAFGSPRALVFALRGTPQETRRLINFRATRDNEYLKSKMIARKQWEIFLEEMGVEGKVTRQQASKKWENLKKKYKARSITERILDWR
ncbi:unnamed protein product, partial [Gadus morhua 'NCC']